MKRGSFGCKSKDNFEKWVRLLVDGDKDAAKQFMMVSIMSDQCALLDEGQTVALDDTAIFSGLLCVRPRGAIDCLWTNLEAVGNR